MQIKLFNVPYRDRKSDESGLIAYVFNSQFWRKKVAKQREYFSDVSDVRKEWKFHFAILIVGNSITCIQAVTPRSGLANCVQSLNDCKIWIEYTSGAAFFCFSGHTSLLRWHNKNRFAISSFCGEKKAGMRSFVLVADLSLTVREPLSVSCCIWTHPSKCYLSISVLGDILE